MILSIYFCIIYKIFMVKIVELNWVSERFCLTSYGAVSHPPTNVAI